MALGYSPKTSSVTIDYICDKDANFFHWVTKHAWNYGYDAAELAVYSPKGRIVYEDGTLPTEPTLSANKK